MGEGHRQAPARHTVARPRAGPAPSGPDAAPSAGLAATDLVPARGAALPWDFSGSSQRTSFENRWVWSGRQRRTLAQGASAWRYTRVHRIRDIAVGLPIPRQDRRAGQRPGVREAQAPQTVATTTAAHAHNMTGGLRRCAKATRSTATGTRAEAARSTGTGARAEAGLLWQRAAVATCAVQRWGVQWRAAVPTATGTRTEAARSTGTGARAEAGLLWQRAAVATCAVQRWGVQRRAAVATAVERSGGSGQSVQPRAAVATGVGRSCGGPI